MRRFLEFSRKAALAGGWLAAIVFLPALILISFGDIAGRRLFLYSSTPLQELEWHFFFAIVTFSMGYAYVRDRHVRVDIFRERFTPRVKLRLEQAMIVGFLLPTSLVLIWFGGRMAWLSFMQDEVSRAAEGLPARWVMKSLLPIGGVFLLFASCWRLAHPLWPGGDERDAP